MTIAERKLWSVLRGAQAGHSFRRQHPIGPYVADFWCADAQLVVEVDGGQHGFPENVASDAGRTAALARQGIKVIRFWNNDVLRNIEGVWDAIAAEVHNRVESRGRDIPPAPQSGLSPGKGEDRGGLTPDPLGGRALP